jgi:hypothetical protein
MKLVLKKGVTSQILLVWIADSSSTTGAGKTGLVHNSAGLTAYYSREGAGSATAVGLSDMTLGSYTSGGFKELSATNMPGVYQFCPPDAVLASGASYAIVLLKGASNMAPVVLEIQLIDCDLEDATSLGLTRLDAAVSSRLAPTVAGRTLDVAAGGEAGIDLDNTVGTLGAAEIPNLDAAISSRSTVTTGQVNAEVVDVLTVDTIPELSQAQPATTPTVATALMLLYMALRNQLTQTASEMKIRNNAGTVICKSATSDDGSTFTRDKLAAGP